MKCPKCNYEWRPRVDNPKECPQCKTRLKEAAERGGKMKEPVKYEDADYWENYQQTRQFKRVYHDYE